MTKSFAITKWESGQCWLSECRSNYVDTFLRSTYFCILCLNFNNFYYSSLSLVKINTCWEQDFFKWYFTSFDEWMNGYRRGGTYIRWNAAAAAAKSFQSCPTFATLWTVAHQAPLSLGFSRQEYWSGLPCSPPGDLPHPGMGVVVSYISALAGGFFTSWVPGKPQQAWGFSKDSMYRTASLL